MLRLSHLLLPALCASALAQSPPAGFEQVDFDIQIGMLPAQLRFDKEQFVVAPDSRVKLTLSNTDAMQHNLVICAQGEGVAAKVAAGIVQLGAAASEKHYVPDMPEVLASTKAIFFEQSDTIWFRAPKKPGKYEYVCTLPGHSFTMKGVMLVGVDAEPGGVGPIDNLRFRVFRGSWSKLPDFRKLTPFHEGDLDGGILQLGPLRETRDFGAVFTGSIECAKAGKHTFFLNSDDGSRLFVDDREVVSYDGLHGPAKEQRGDVQLQAGAHQLRVEFFQRGGGQDLRVAFAGPDGKRRKLSGTENRPAKVTAIAVHHHPVVMRVHVEGASARTIAVGLPNGMNYAFDAQRCCVQFGWAGAYLDVGPDRDGRGGRPCKTLGPRFGVGDVGCPLRTANGHVLPIRFGGYRVMPLPTFELDWGGRRVDWRIESTGTDVGLQYTFSFERPIDEGIQFVLDPRKVRTTTSLRELRNGTFVVPAGTETFSITIRPKEGV